MPRMHLVAIGLVGVAILGSILMNSGGDDEAASPGTLDVPAVRLIDAPKIVPARPETPETIPVREVAEATKDGGSPGQLPVRERVQLGGGSPVPGSPGSAIAGAAGPQDDVGPQSGSKGAPGDAVALASTGSASSEPKPGNAGAPSTAPAASTGAGNSPGGGTPEGATGDEPVTVSQPSARSEPAPASAPATSSTAAIAEERPAAPDPEVQRRETFLAARSRPAGAARDENWLLEQTPAAYTLQVLGTYSAESARKFVKQQGNRENFVIFRTRLNGRDWHVVVYNMYPNRNAAVAAIQTLPWALRKQKPWARSMESIHKAILEDRTN